jgi:hypothetical protein
MQKPLYSVTLNKTFPNFSSLQCYIQVHLVGKPCADLEKLYYTVKTPDADFRTYNRMPQDQTVQGAESVSCLWAA